MQARRRNDGGSDDWLQDDDAMSARVQFHGPWFATAMHPRVHVQYEYAKMGSSN